MSTPKILSDDELQEVLIEFERQISSNKKLPQNIDKIVLLRLLKFFNGNVERAMRRLITGLEVRKTYPNLFFNRDSADEQLRSYLDKFELVQMPKLTDANERVLFLRLTDPNPDGIDFEEALKVYFMTYDMLSVRKDTETSLASGEVLIYDMSNMSLRHITKAKFLGIRAYYSYMLKAHPIRVTQIHIINCSPLLDKLFALSKPFTTSKMLEISHFHEPNSTTLFDHLSKDVLPSDLGGSGESVKVLMRELIEYGDGLYEYFLDDSRWKIKENEDE